MIGNDARKRDTPLAICCRVAVWNRLACLKAYWRANRSLFYRVSFAHIIFRRVGSVHRRHHCLFDVARQPTTARRCQPNYDALFSRHSPPTYHSIFITNHNTLDIQSTLYTQLPSSIIANQSATLPLASIVCSVVLVGLATLNCEAVLQRLETPQSITLLSNHLNLIDSQQSNNILILF
jgi:hypothetical protein